MIWAENPLFSETSMFLSFSSINSVNACLQIHWSVGNALALFTRAVHCSGEINWASGLKNLCNNSNKHLGGETSKSFFFEFGIHPWKKRNFGEDSSFIYPMNLRAYIFLHDGLVEENQQQQQPGIKSSWRTSVSCSVSSWRPGVSWTPPMHWSGRGRGNGAPAVERWN